MTVTTSVPHHRLSLWLDSTVSAVQLKELTPEEMFAEMKQKAEAGDAKAQVELFKMYKSGEGNYVLSSGGNLTPGTISAMTGLGNNTNQIQITAPIQPGSSGSPVMDKKGNVLGVVSAKLDDGKMARATGQVGENVNFAVNGATVKAFLDANKVPYKTGGGFFSREKTNADIAEDARKWTVLLECWK